MLIGWWSRGTICNNGQKRGTLHCMHIYSFHLPHRTPSPLLEYKYKSFQILLKSLCFKIFTCYSPCLSLCGFVLQSAKCKCVKVEVSWVIHLRSQKNHQRSLSVLYPSLSLLIVVEFFLLYLMPWGRIETVELRRVKTLLHVHGRL